MYILYTYSYNSALKSYVIKNASVMVKCTNVKFFIECFSRKTIFLIFLFSYRVWGWSKTARNLEKFALSSLKRIQQEIDVTILCISMSIIENRYVNPLNYGYCYWNYSVYCFSNNLWMMMIKKCGHLCWRGWWSCSRGTRPLHVLHSRIKKNDSMLMDHKRGRW